MPEIERKPRASLDEILERLDELTPYYRRHMSSLSPQQRRAACALARLGCGQRGGRPGEQARAQGGRHRPHQAEGQGRRGALRQEVQLSDPWLGAWYRTRRGGPGELGEPPDVPLPPAPSGWDEILLAAGESLPGELATNRKPVR